MIKFRKLKKKYGTNDDDDVINKDVKQVLHSAILLHNKIYAIAYSKNFSVVACGVSAQATNT